MKRSMLSITLFLDVALVACAIPSYADSTWAGPGSDFNDPSNWTTGVPTGTVNAIFSGATPYAVTIATNTQLVGFIYTPGAASYTSTLPDSTAGYSVLIGTGGIQNQSSNLQRVNMGSGVEFVVGGSIAGNVQITNGGSDSIAAILGTGSLSGNVIIDNASTGITGFTIFFGTDTMHAGHALLENSGGGIFVLEHGFRGDLATILNDSGTLTVTSDADLSSVTVVNAGRINVSGIFGSSITLGSLSGSGTVDTTGKSIAIGGNSADTEFSGVILGASGNLIKVGTGTLTLSGINTYSGGSIVMDGTLQVNTNSLPGNVTDYATLTFNQSFDGAYSGLLYGTGTVTTAGVGEVTLSSASPFSGTFDVAQGTLNLAQTMVASASVEPDGVLTGIGQIGAINNRGIVRPGSGTSGTFTAASYGGPGTLQIPFNGAAHPQLAVTGAATLTGGALQFTGTQFTPGLYTLVNASTVNGTFSTVSAPAFLAYSTLYTPTQVQVLMKSYDFMNAAQSGNEQAIAGALDSVGNPATAASGPATTPLAVALQKISQLTTANAVHTAFEQMSGDSLTSFYDVGLRQGRLFTEGLTERAVPMDSAAPSLTLAPVLLAMNGDAGGLGIGAKPPTKQRGVWARALGAFASTKADASNGSPSNSANTGGFQAGFDFQPNDTSLLGVFAGYTRTGVSVDDRDSTGDTNSFGLGVYGRYAPGAWFFDGAAAYIHNSNEMDRVLGFAGQTAHSSFSSPLLTIYGDGGYAFEPAQDTAVEPFLALRISHLSQSEFTETDAPGENLSVDQQSITSAVPMLAVRATHLFKPETRHPFILGGGLGLEFEMGSTDRNLTAQFADAAGTSFTVHGTPQQRVGVDFNLGGRLAISEHWQAFANYGLTAASEHFIQAIMGGARLTW